MKFPWKKKTRSEFEIRQLCQAVNELSEAAQRFTQVSAMDMGANQKYQDECVMMITVQATEICKRMFEAK